MILEEINGVEVIFNNKTLVVGDSVEDSQYALIDVLGIGKAIFRTGPSTTTEINGKPNITPAPVAVSNIVIPPPTSKVEVIPTPKVNKPTVE